MKRIVIGIIAVAVLWLLFDRIGGMLMRQVCRHTHDMTTPAIRHLTEEADEDLILLGASRCNAHYVPSILQDSLHLRVYNGGVDGSHDIYAHYLSLCYLLEHHAPKIICLELFDGDLIVEEDPFYTISYYAPYFGKSATADSVFDLAGTSGLYRLSHLYRYNAKSISNFTGLVKRRRSDENGGYTPVPKPPMAPQELSRQADITEYDSTKIAYIEKFIGRCQERGIQLVLTISPCYTVADSSHYAKVREIAQKHDVPLLDYHTSGLFRDKPVCFHDEMHLWDSSARVFSSVFASDLLRLGLLDQDGK